MPSASVDGGLCPPSCPAAVTPRADAKRVFVTARWRAAGGDVSRVDGRVVGASRTYLCAGSVVGAGAGCRWRGREGRWSGRCCGSGPASCRRSSTTSTLTATAPPTPPTARLVIDPPDASRNAQSWVRATVADASTRRGAARAHGGLLKPRRSPRDTSPGSPHHDELADTSGDLRGRAALSQAVISSRSARSQFPS